MHVLMVGCAVCISCSKRWETGGHTVAGVSLACYLVTVF